MKQIFLLLILPLMTSCQTKDYPELINKAPEYANTDYEKKHFQEFAVYEDATTKNTNLPKGKVVANKRYP